MDLATIVAIVSIVAALGTIASHIHKHGLEQLLKKIGVILLVVTIGWFFIIYALFPGLRSMWAKVPPNPAPPIATGKDFVNTLGMKFVLVSKGTFWMSSSGRNAQKQVTIPLDFYLGAYEVTQGQWQGVMGTNPSWFSRTGGGRDTVQHLSDAELEQLPVEEVSWVGAQEYIRKLNIREKDSGWLYRLAMEAEWEYACRGGATSKAECSFDFYLDQPSNVLTSAQANIEDKLGRTAKVGSYRPNRLGLYDMHGNVWEWCEDSIDGASLRVFRGGCWHDDSSGCRAAGRYVLAPSHRSGALGLRLARVPSGVK